MFLCPNCRNIFDITNVNTELQQTGGNQNGGAPNVNYDEIITKILNKEFISDTISKQLSLDDLTKKDSYNSLKSSSKEYVYNKVAELLHTYEESLKNVEIKKSTTELQFICNNCGTKEKIKENTLIFSKVSNDISQSYVSPNLLSMKHSDIIPVTKKYICPNATCESHKDFNKREAKFFRLNNSYRVKYICLACDEIFDSA